MRGNRCSVKGPQRSHIRSSAPLPLSRQPWNILCPARLLPPDALQIRRASGLLDPAGRDFVLRNLAAGIDGPMREQVRAPPARPMVRDEDRIRPYGSDHHRFENDLAAPRCHFHPVRIRDAQPCRQARVDLDSRLRVLLNQRPDSPRLRAGEIHVDRATRREKDRIVRIKRIARGPPVAYLKVRLAVGMPELPVLEKPRSAGMADGGAGPKNTEFPFHTVPGDAVIIRDTALRCAS